MTIVSPTCGVKRRGLHPSTVARVGRAGFVLFEVVAGLAIVGICLWVLARLSVWQSLEQGRRERQAEALEQATNVLETWWAKPWDDLSSDGEWTEPLASELLDGEVVVAVEAAEVALARRIQVEVRWQERLGPRQVRLVAFRCPPLTRQGGR